jgi:hypothetical protein
VGLIDDTHNYEKNVGDYGDVMRGGRHRLMECACHSGDASTEIRSHAFVLLMILVQQSTGQSWQSIEPNEGG